MKLPFLMAVLVGLARMARAQETNVPVKISAEEASAHYDQVMTVTGVVAQVSLRPSIVFIDLDQPYPDSPFSAIIRSQNTNQFSNLPGLKGRPVELTGKVQKYHDRPEIVIERPGQIQVSGGWPPPTKLPAVTTPPHPASPAAPPATNDLTNGMM